MAFELAGRNCLVVGEFNQAIVRPNWLVKNGIMKDGEVQHVLSDHPSLMRTFRFGGYEWHIGADRLSLNATVPTEGDPGAVLSRLLEVLPHTPVSGLGQNFLFQSPTVSEALIPHLGKLSPDRFARKFEHEAALSSQAIFSLPTRDEYRLQIKVIVEPDKHTIDLNFHFAVKDAEAAIQAAKRSEEFRSTAERVIEALTE